MRERIQIERQVENVIERGIAAGSTEIGLKALQPLFLETLLDCRDLLQKLVEKRARPLVTTEVPLSAKEQSILDGIPTD